MRFNKVQERSLDVRSIIHSHAAHAPGTHVIFCPSEQGGAYYNHDSVFHLFFLFGGGGGVLTIFYDGSAFR